MRVHRCDVEASIGDLPAGLHDRLAGVPAIRLDAVAQARTWLERGVHPSAADVARTVVASFMALRSDAPRLA